MMGEGVFVYMSLGSPAPIRHTTAAKCLVVLQDGMVPYFFRVKENNSTIHGDPNRFSWDRGFFLDLPTTQIHPVYSGE